MKIVLLQDVKKLGKKDQIVEVSAGYARNMIIPKKFGVEATPENLNNLKLKNKNEEKKDENYRRIANATKNDIEKKLFVLKVKAGVNGKTFGSITSSEIADEIMKICNISIDKKDILLDESIKNIGLYDIKLKLYKEIVATIKLKVDEE